MAARSGLELLSAIVAGEHPPAPIQQTLGFTLDEVEEGRAVFSARGRPSATYNPLGTMHGGVAATLLDSAMACAVHSTLPAGRDATRRSSSRSTSSAPRRAETGRIVAEGTLVDTVAGASRPRRDG